MRTCRTALAAMVVAGMTSGVVLAQADSAGGDADSRASASEQQQQGRSAQRAEQAPDGWVLVQERVVVLTANEPQNHFLRAQQFLTQNDAKAAAGEMRMAAAYIDMQAARGRGQADPGLTQAADQLRKLAGQIGHQQQQGADAQQQQQQLKQGFARANVALAKHLQTLAQREIQSQKNVMAGHDLDSAVESLAAAYAWSGQQPPQDVTDTLQQSQQLAVKLMLPGDATAGQQPDADAARTAAARMDARGAQAPQDAQKTLDRLAQAIEQARGAFDAGSSGSSGTQQQQQGRQQQQ
jgi:hypothetical protein